MYIRYLGCELHGGRHHVHTLLPIAQAQEDVAQQHQAAARQSVQVLGIGHLQSLSQVSLTFSVLGREE